jgi:hypothetical protein
LAVGRAIGESAKSFERLERVFVADNISNNPSSLPPASPAATEPSGASDDPLAHLHKMSRTAGLGTEDYVAVNATAVAALLLGLLSFSTVLGTFLLIIPAAAIVVAIASIVQIRRSGGTQTGNGIAISGLVLALLCLGLVGGREILHDREVAAEQGQIIDLIDKLGKSVSMSDYDTAWKLFSPRFRESVKKDDFVRTWTSVQAFYGPIKQMRWNELLDVEIDYDPASKTTSKMARGKIIVELQNGQRDDRQDLSLFRKVDQQWFIEAYPLEFRSPAAAAAPQPQ